MSHDILIIGGGVAAAHFCRGLRLAGCVAPILMFSEENVAPYERPALTKSYLVGRKTPDDLAILKRNQLLDLNVDARLGVECVEIDVDARIVRTGDGKVVPYGRLVVATGLLPRRLIGVPQGVRHHAVRSLWNIDCLKRDLTDARKVVVIGGGWLGLEIAAHLVDLKKSVTLIDAAPTVCSRNAPSAISERLTNFHRMREVDLRLSTSILAMSRDGGQVCVCLSDDTVVRADVMVEAIGVVSKPIESAGALQWDATGVIVDGLLRTNCADIYAIGDVSRVTPDLTGVALRLETWANAVAQGEHLARVFMGGNARFELDTWFWSDQSDQNIQVVGFPHLATEVEEVIATENEMFARYLLHGQLIGAASINRFKEIKLAKREIRKSPFLCH
jgi:3-phenylpropionate/trans-cinnamate dioxygenase ferredoxin reductase component